MNNKIAVVQPRLDEAAQQGQHDPAAAVPECAEDPARHAGASHGKKLIGQGFD